MKNRHCPAFRICREDCGDCAHSIKYNKLYGKINRQKAQKAEIERLQKYNADMAHKHYNDGIKEFAERLKESAFDCDVYFGYGVEHYTKVVTVIEIENLVKEMTEGEQHESV